MPVTEAGITIATPSLISDAEYKYGEIAELIGKLGQTGTRDFGTGNERLTGAV